MTPPSDSTDKVIRTSPLVYGSNMIAMEASKGNYRSYVAAADFENLASDYDALQARYDALEKSRGEFIKRSADYAAELAALRKSVQHAFTRFAYHELKRAATGEGQL